MFPSFFFSSYRTFSQPTVRVNGSFKPIFMEGQSSIWQSYYRSVVCSGKQIAPCYKHIRKLEVWRTAKSRPCLLNSNKNLGSKGLKFKNLKQKMSESCYYVIEYHSSIFVHENTFHLTKFTSVPFFAHAPHSAAAGNARAGRPDYCF